MAIKLLKKILAWQNYWNEINSGNRERQLTLQNPSKTKNQLDTLIYLVKW